MDLLDLQTEYCIITFDPPSAYVMCIATARSDGDVSSKETENPAEERDRHGAGEESETREFLLQGDFPPIVRYLPTGITMPVSDRPCYSIPIDRIAGSYLAGIFGQEGWRSTSHSFERMEDCRPLVLVRVEVSFQDAQVKMRAKWAPESQANAALACCLDHLTAGKQVEVARLLGLTWSL